VNENERQKRKKTHFDVAEYKEISVAYFISQKTIAIAINLDSLSRAETGIFPPSCSLIVDWGDIYFVRVFKKFTDFRKIARMTSPGRMPFCFSRNT
jgi:hypothetical protein